MRPFPLWLRWLLAAILLGSVAAGAGLDVWMRGHTPREVQAMRLAGAGHYDKAAELYFQELESGDVTVPLVVAFLEAQTRSGAPPPHRRARDEDGTLETFDHGKRKAAESIRDHALEEILDKPTLAPEIALLGRYWRDVLGGGVLAEDQARVEAAADGATPTPWANHLLAKRALVRGDAAEGLRRFEREGLAFGRSNDIAMMFALLERDHDWEGIGKKLSDTRVVALAAPWVRFRYAVESRNWPAVARLSWTVAWAGRVTLGTFLLAAVSCLAWFAFCFRLGRATERPAFRVPIFLLAPVLGALSIVPTDALIALQESILHLTQTGDMGRDALFYLFGVGFREELSKLLLFAPLVPILRRGNATKLDVLVAGALVGLGFATIENLAYFASADLTNAMARFLTANFLHMALTGLAAAALWEGARDPERLGFDASKTFLTMVAIHGAYDFFLSAPGGMSYLGMVLFLVLARMFTGEVHQVRGRAGRGPSLFDVFVVGATCIAGTSYVYASAMVGPRLAAAALLEGMIGLAIIAFFFVQELRRL